MKMMILLSALYLLTAPTCASSSSLEKLLPSSAAAQKIRSDYSTKAASLVTGSTKDEDLIISIQDAQSFRFKSFDRDFAVLPFTYLPNKPEAWRKCMIRIFAQPGHIFVQDLEASTDEVPCNGITALSFKDVNSDVNREIIVLYDLTTPGNKSIEPGVAVYAYEQASQVFVLDAELSSKAAGKRIRNIRDALRNLSYTH